MFENPRTDRKTRNFTTNVPKILDLKSSSEQIFSENLRWVPLKAPHSLRIVFDSGEVGIQAATQCSCKAGTGICQHLAALFTHVMAKLRDDDSPTSHLQQ